MGTDENQGGAQSGTAAEPFEGYSTASVDAVVKAIDDAPDEQREALKDAIRAAELARGEDARKGVLAATEPTPPTVVGADPDEQPEEEGPEDTSGRPPLAEIAEQRVRDAALYERVVNTDTEED